MTKSTGMYPDAHPTAPGGMSRKALIAELENEHDYESDDWDAVSWPDLIDYVAQARLEAEAERPEPDNADDTERIESEPDESYEMFPDDIDADADESLLGNAPVFNEDARYGDFDDDMDLDVDAMFPDTYTPRARLTGTDDLIAEQVVSYPGQMLEIDEACKCGTPESEHHTVDPPHAFIPQGIDEYMAHETDLEVELAKAIADEDGLLDPEALFAEMFSAQEQALADGPAPIFLGIPGVKDYVFDGHAGAGPSGAERWMNCTMSLSASRAFLETMTPNQQREFASGSTAARQGTTAHAAGEAKANHMLGRLSGDELDDVLLDLAVSPAEGEEYDTEMDEYTDEYVDLIRTYSQERGAEHILIESVVEAAIPLTGMHEDEVYMIRGSVDFSALPEKKHPDLVVGDLKYGEGKDVDVDENPQIRLYALAILMLLVDENGELPMWMEDVTYYIAQPRLGGIKKWTETIDDLLEWRDEVLSPALTAALYGRDEGGATFTPSDLACQWCPARGTCPALAEHVMTRGEELFDAIQDAEFIDGPGALPDPIALDNDKLGNLLLQVKDLEKLSKSLREEAQRRLHRGEAVKNFHLVNHTPKRTWKADAAEKIGEVETLDPDTLIQLWTHALVTPTQAEKILGDGYASIVDLINKPDKIPLISTGPKDRRKAWEGRAPEAMFADDLPDDIEEE